MDPQFWHERWARGEIGFHRGDVHPLLVRHGAPLAGRRVLVPLCGKSLDLVHLAGLGCTVVGIELSAAAIGAFFAERGLEPAVTTQGPGRLWEAGPYTLLEGDYFAFSAADLGAPCTGLYDRAALIALPPARRAAYAAHTARLLAPDVWGLVITLDYPQEAMAGPPFAVPEAEVRALYDPWAGVAALEREDALAAEPRFAERGLTRLHQTAWALARRGA
jgi:thiopurine S-methyltransferase